MCSIRTRSGHLFKFNNSRLVGVLAVHVDDILWCGAKEFETGVINGLRSKFHISNESKCNFTYLGIDVTQDESGTSISLGRYINDLEPISITPLRSKKHDLLTKPESRLLRGAVGQALYASTICRPDIGFDVLELTMMKNESAKVESLIHANKLINRLKTEQFCAIFPPLDRDSIEFIVFSDASHASPPDGVSSSLGYIIFMSDGVNSCPISWKSGKIQRVVRSTLAAEALALGEAADVAYFLAMFVKEALKLPTTPPINC